MPFGNKHSSMTHNASVNYAATERGALALIAMISLYSFFMACTIFYLPIYFQRDLGFSGMETGIVFALQGLGVILGTFPMGIASDRIAPRKLTALLVAFMGLCALALNIWTAFVAVLGAVAGYRVASLYSKVTAETYLYKSQRSAASTSKVFGLFLSARMIATGSGVIAAGYLLEYAGFMVAFGLLAAVSALVAVGSWFLPSVHTTTASTKQYKADLFNAEAIFLIVWLFLFATHWGAEEVSYSLFLREDMGLSMSQSGWYMAGEFLSVGLTAWILRSKYPKPHNELIPLIIALMLSGAGHIFMVTDNLYVSFAWRFLHGIGDAFMMIAVYMHIAAIFPVERIGGTSAFNTTIASAGMLVGAIGYGWASDYLGNAFPLQFSGVLLLALIPVHIFWRWLRGPLQHGATASD